MKLIKNLTACVLALQLIVISPPLFAGKSPNQNCCGSCPSSKDKSTNNPTSEPMITDEVDKTDIYAIPLDMDEKEEKQEMQMLESKSK